MDDTSITLDFADGVYTFALPMPQVISAEREMTRRDPEGKPIDHSMFTVLHEIGAGTGKIAGEMVIAGSGVSSLTDAHTIIRNALIGGASGIVNGEHIRVNAAMARELVAVYCYPSRPAMHDIELAWNILQAAVYGIDPNITGSKKKAGGLGDPQPS